MSRATILIVDDDTVYAGKLCRALEGVFHVETCHSQAEFRNHFSAGRYDLLIMDMRLEQDREGLVLLREALADDPLQAAIVMTAYADMETYTDALEAGAMTYLDKAEFSPALIARTVEAIVGQGRMRRRVSDLENRLERAEPLEVIGASLAIRRVRDELRHAAEADSVVVLVGEPGAGKELAARNIHRLSRRRAEGSFVHATCGRLRREEIARRMFGPQGLERGRTAVPKGWIEEARGGVLFIDGVEGLDVVAWRRLIGLIAPRAGVSPGGERRGGVDAQLVIATTLGTERTIQELAGKSGVVRIDIPPLRQHPEDIALIAQYTVQNLHRDGRTQARALRGAALSVLESMPWPGNIRELKSAVTYAAIRADAAGEREIGPEHLPMGGADLPAAQANGLHPGGYQEHLARAELALVESAIEAFGITKKADLAMRLGYNDRFVFARRIRKCLTSYPQLWKEFPKTAGMAVDLTQKNSINTGKKVE